MSFVQANSRIDWPVAVEKLKHGRVKCSRISFIAYLDLSIYHINLWNEKLLME